MEEKSILIIDHSTTPKEVIVAIDAHDDDNDDGKDCGTSKKDNGNFDDTSITKMTTYATPEQRVQDVAHVDIQYIFVMILDIAALVLTFSSIHYGIEKYPVFLSILVVLLLLIWTACFLLPWLLNVTVTKAEVAVKDFCFGTLSLTTLRAIASALLWESQVLHVFAAVLAGLTMWAQFISIAAMLQTGNSTEKAPLETDAQRRYHRLLSFFMYMTALASMALIVKSYVSILLGEPLRALFSSMTGLIFFAFTTSMAALLVASHRHTIHDAPITDPSCQTFFVDTTFGLNFYFAAFLPVVLFIFSEAIYWGRQELAAFNVPIYLSLAMLLAQYIPLEACQFHILSSPTATLLVETRSKTYCYSNIVRVSSENYNSFRPSHYGSHAYYGTGGRKLRKQAVVMELDEGTKLCIMTDCPTELMNAIQAAVSAADAAATTDLFF